MQRLSMATCPACERVNAPHAKFCSACGTPLVMRCPSCNAINVRSREACHHCGKALAGAEGPDRPEIEIERIDVVAPPLLNEPLSELPKIDLPKVDWTLSLRGDARPAPAGAPDAALLQRGPEAPEPVVDTVPGFLVADRDAPSMARAEFPDIEGLPEIAPPPLEAPAPAPAPAPPAAAKPPEKALAKARRRANVRRARLLAHGPAKSLPREVLVLEADAQARSDLCQLLELFGFRPQVAVSVAEAEGLSARTDHAVVFLGMGSDAAAAAELCRHLLERPSHRPRAVIGVGDAKRHTDRVRMELAGAHAMLIRPVSRGDLARALDACELPLPRDPRHGAPPDL
jgi:CheY-like chemotaxis protein